MIKTARKYKWIIFISFYVLLFGSLAVFDEPLHPEAKSILYSPSPAPARENGYFAVMGFTAPAGTDFYAKGVEIVREFEEAFKKDESIERFDHEILLAPELKIAGEPPDIYKDPKFSCLSYARTSKNDIEKMIADNRELLDRYYSLYRYPRIRSAGTPALSAPIPHYVPVRKMHTLVLLTLAGYADSGRINPALEGLKQDIEYWRRILKESDDLITKLVAAAMIKQDYLFLSELLSHRKIGPREWEAAEPLLQPLTLQETCISGPMRHEFQLQPDAMRRMKRSFLKKGPDEKDPGWKFLLWPFFKVNATANIMYPSYKKLIDAAALPAQEFVKESKKWDESKKMKLGMDLFYNAGGAVFQKPIGDRENLRYTSYITRVHDADGLLRLVVLQFGAYRDRITPEKMQKYLLKTGASLANPYTGETMQWDAEKKCLYFESASKENGKPKRIELYL